MLNCASPFETLLCVFSVPLSYSHDQCLSSCKGWLCRQALTQLLYRTACSKMKQWAILNQKTKHRGAAPWIILKEKVLDKCRFKGFVMTRSQFRLHHTIDLCSMYLWNHIWIPDTVTQRLLAIGKFCQVHLNTKKKKNRLKQKTKDNGFRATKKK